MIRQGASLTGMGLSKPGIPLMHIHSPNINFIKLIIPINNYSNKHRYFKVIQCNIFNKITNFILLKFHGLIISWGKSNRVKLNFYEFIIGIKKRRRFSESSFQLHMLSCYKYGWHLIEKLEGAKMCLVNACRSKLAFHELQFREGRSRLAAPNMWTDKQSGMGERSCWHTSWIRRYLEILPKFSNVVCVSVRFQIFSKL